MYRPTVLDFICYCVFVTEGIGALSVAAVSPAVRLSACSMSPGIGVARVSALGAHASPRVGQIYMGKVVRAAPKQSVQPQTGQESDF